MNKYWKRKPYRYFDWDTMFERIFAVVGILTLIWFMVRS